MKIIGLTCHFSGNHDNSAALLSNGEIIFAESEERISRIKHDTQFPIKSIRHSLKYGKTRIAKINYFVSASPPTSIIKLFKSYSQGFRYTTFGDILTWIRDRLIISVSELGFKKTLDAPKDYSEAKLPGEKLMYVSHYLAHAETAYSFSGMSKCLVVAWDGYGVNELGEPLCGAVYSGNEGELRLLKQIPVYASLALYYGAVTMALGFKLNDGEGKTMGLAAYGRKSGAVNKLKKIFPHFRGGKWIPKTNWLQINGVSRPSYFRRTNVFENLKSLISEYGDKNVAFAAQYILEEESEKFFRHLVRKYKERNIAVAGGIFLNVKFNMKLLRSKIANKLFIYPNPSDGGVAVGAAIALYKSFGNKFKNRLLEYAALGCKFNSRESLMALRTFRKKINYKKITSYTSVAKDIAGGKVIGWFKGRGEWGPRALGQRSVLADPREIETKERINKYLKQRDWFMPFAPVILDEYKDKVLKNGYATPFMTLTDNVNRDYLKKIPAAVHIDGTARAQIVDKTVNKPYWEIVNEFRKITGIPVLLNTSFNRHGLPIVHSPKEAVEHLLWGCVDELVLENYLVTRKEN